MTNRAKTDEMTIGLDKYNKLAVRSAFFEHAPNLCYMVGLDKRILDCNDEVTRVLGYTKEELIGQPLSMIYTPESQEMIPALFKRWLREGSLRNIELKTISKSGQVFDIDLNVDAIRDLDGRIVRSISIQTIITARKQVERAYKVLAQANHIMLHANEENKFLTDICQMIIDIGDYRLVWVGFGERDEAKTVKPVAQAGFGQDYLDSVGITWADTERGQGPTGTAIREGRTVVCQNITTDPRFEPWRAEGLKRGYQSSIAIPLFDADEVMGAINIYSPRPDAFDKNEEQLLAELAKNVSFTIKTIRTGKQQNLSESRLRVSETKFKQLFENISSGVIIYEAINDGEDFVINDFNRAGSRIEKIAKEKVIGRLVTEVFPGVRDFGLYDVLKRVLKTGKPEHFPIGQYTDERITGWRDNYVYKLPTGEIVAVYDDLTGQKQDEEAIIEAKALLSKAEEIASLGSWEWDLNDQITASDEFYRLFGWNPGEVKVTTSTYLQAVYPGDKDLVKVQMQKILSGLESAPYRHRIIRTDGEVRTLLSGVRIQRDNTGAPQTAVGTIQDITEREMTENNLKEAIAEWDDTFNSIGDAICLLDRDRHILKCNQAMIALSGQSLSQLIGRNCHEIMHNSTEPINDCPLTRLWQSKKRENSIIKIGDKWLRVTADPRFGPDGELLGAVHVMADVSESIRNQKQLVKSEGKLRAMFKYMSSGIIVTDLAGNIGEVNEAAMKLLGSRHREEVIGSDVLAVVLKTDQDRAMADMKKTLDRGFSGVLEYDIKRDDGQKFPGELSVSPLYDEDGKPEGFVIIIDDITQRKLAEQSINDSLEKIKRSMESTIRTVTALVEARDPYTVGHDYEVGMLATAIAREMDLDQDMIEGIQIAAKLHDIGKISVPVEILSKPGRISEAEFEIIKEHPRIGHDILVQTDFPYPVADIVLQHHERFDGSGYPNGIERDDIMLEAKILAVADVIEAMASHRPYREALGLETAMNEVKDKRGILFDPEVVDACLRVFYDKGYELKGQKIKKPEPSPESSEQ